MRHEFDQEAERTFFARVLSREKDLVAFVDGDSATVEELSKALRRCVVKLKLEYDRQNPDATPRECWAEAEHGLEVLMRTGEPYLREWPDL